MSLYGWNPFKKIKCVIPPQGSELENFPVLLNLSGESGELNFDCSAVFDEFKIDSYTKLLICSDTTDGNTTFIDGSPSGHTITANDNVHHESDQAKFGNTSIYFDGTGDFLEIADSDDWNISKNTIDCWVYFLSTASDIPICSQLINDDNRWQFGWDQTNGWFSFYCSDAGIDVGQYRWNYTPDIDTWMHLAIVITDNAVSLYINGTALAGTEIIALETLPNLNAPLKIGYARFGTANQFLYGYIDEFRISKGIVRWTENFTPHIAPYASNKRIAIEIGDTGNQCYCEIENWEENNAQIWVKIPSISATEETVLNLYYDNAQPNNDFYIGNTEDIEIQVFPEYTGFDTQSVLQTYNRRQVIEAVALTAHDGSVKIVFHYIDTDYVITNCWIYLRDVGMNAIIDSGVQVTFNENTTHTITATDFISDPIDFEITGTVDIIISFFQDDSSLPYNGTPGQPDNTDGYYKAGSDESGNEIVTGYSTSDTWAAIQEIISVQPAQEVWDDNFVAVYHMSQDPSGGSLCILDSTGNAHNGTPVNMVSGDLQDANIGKCLYFNNSNKYIVTSNETGFDMTDQVTCEAVTYRTQTEWGALLSKGYDETYEFKGQDNLSWRIKPGGSDTTIALASDKNIWQYLVGSYSPSNMLSYNNGEQVGSSSITGSFANNSDPFEIGRDNSSGEYGGLISEVRVSDIQRSSHWLLATYYSLFDTLITYSPNGLNENKKIILTISPQSEELLDFPVLVNLSSLSGISNLNCSPLFSDIGINGKRIFFVDVNSNEQLYAEIENWEDGNAQVWVKVPVISATENTVIYLYYENLEVDNDNFIGDTGEIQAQQVWDDNFVAVYHMSQDPGVGGACILDSTSNENHGTPNGTMTSDDLVDGFIGKAITFDGIDDIINLGSDSSLSFTMVNGLTLEALVQTVDDGANNAIISTLNASNNHKGYELECRGGSEDDFYCYVVNSWTDNSLSIETNGIVANNNNLYNVAFSAVGTDGLVYVDGADVGSVVFDTLSSTDIQSGIDVLIAARNDDSNYFDGVIEEIRLSNIARSENWLLTTNLSNRDTLITFSFPPEDEGITDRFIPAFTNFAKSYNISFMPGIKPASLIRQKRKGFSKAF